MFSIRIRFLKLFSNYECGHTISHEHAKILLDNGIIEPSRIITKENIKDNRWYNEEDLGTVDMDGENEYLEIFFNIVKLQLPDIEWKTANLGFSLLHILEGSGYGLFHL